mgnify:CR=1 FL=1
MGQSHLPHERFNLYHIDNLEIHLESLTVSAFLHDIDPTKPPTKESDQKLRKHFLAIKWGFTYQFEIYGIRLRHKGNFARPCKNQI